mgnify:FL=1
MNQRNTVGAKISAFLCIVLAAPATFGLVIAMNKLTSGLEEETGPKVVQFSIDRQEKKKKKKQKPQQLNIQRRTAGRSRQKRSLAPLPELGNGVSGIKVDMPEYEGAELTSVSGSMLGNLDNVVMTEDTVDNRPVIKRRTPIQYPPRARKQNIQGRVVLNILIGRDGRVEKIKILEAEPKGVFEEPAVRSVKQWVFIPATYKNKPVRMWGTLPLNFGLK